MILMVSTSNCHYPFPIRWEFGLERINQRAVNRLKYQLPCLLFYHKACLAGLCHWNKNKACQLKHLLAALVHLPLFHGTETCLKGLCHSNKNNACAGVIFVGTVFLHLLHLMVQCLCTSFPNVVRVVFAQLNL